MNSATLRRLASDHAALYKFVLPPYYVHYTDASTADDLTQLIILLAGPSGTPYENGIWKLHLRIPRDYPTSPPKASFRTKIFHPNIEEATGAVCLDTLKRDWSPHLTLRDILITISCLLINPNPDSALNAAAGKLLQDDFDAFSRKARLMTSIHARIPLEFKTSVIEAINRGDDISDQDSEGEVDYSDEASEFKENDPSISPSPVSPPKPIQRNTILGKRPLADLPAPPEPIEEAALERNAPTQSQLNISANNTPNLSSDLSTLSFTTTTTTSTIPTATTTYPNPNPKRQRIFTFTGLATSSNPAESYSHSHFHFQFHSSPHSAPHVHQQQQQQPPAKRQRTVEGKENEAEPLSFPLQILVDECDAEREGEGSVVKKCRKTGVGSTAACLSASLGLGVKIPDAGVGAVTHGGVKHRISGGKGSRTKVRLGIRRL